MTAALLISVDGLRPDAIAAARCPTLHALIDRGAYTLSARSVMPCITLPCHMSMFHSVPPSRHGVTSNDWTPMARPVPGLVDVAKAAGLRWMAFYGWEPLRNLSLPLSLYGAFFRDNSEDLASDGDRVIAEEAGRAIVAERPDAAFVYLGNVDAAGHAYGWMSDGYLAQVERVDTILGRLLETVSGLGATICLQSDHGGHDRHHGTDSDEDMTIPWLIAGPGIRAGEALQRPISLLDTAPTLARVLGLNRPAQWEGRVVDEAFVA